MNKLKKQTLIGVLAIILLLASVNATYAITAGFLKLQSSVECKSGAECTVSVNFEGLSTDTDDIEFGGTIDYDKDKLELVSLTTSGSWDKAKEGTNYSITTGRFSFGSSEKVEANSKAFDITFKAKEGAEGLATVTLKNIDISGGGNFADASTTVTIKKDTTTPNNNIIKNNTVTTNGVNRNNTSKNDTTVNNQIIPKAGSGIELIMPAITILLIALIAFFYIQNRKVDKKIDDLNKKD